MPDQGGLAYWTQAATTGMTMTQMAAGFMGSPEFQTRFDGLDNATFVAQLYHNVLGRDGEGAGLAAWTQALNSGDQSREQVMLGFSDSAECIGLINTRVGNGVWLS